MKKLIISLALTCIFYSTTAQRNLENELFELPNIIFNSIDPIPGYKSAYEIFIKQPLDHNAPEMGHFYQKVFLNHRGFDAPTIMYTSAYALDGNASGDWYLSDTLNSNVILIEHRFCGESRPDSMIWEKLTLYQAASDFHNIYNVFSDIYSKNWISSGYSEDGSTALFYRYYFPKDVSVTIPISASINKEYDDGRLYPYLNSIGSDDCRAKIYEFQIRLFENRDVILDKLCWYYKGLNEKFTYLSVNEAYEYAILEFPFTFWQYEGTCDSIPVESQDLDELVDYFIETIGLSYFTDSYVHDIQHIWYLWSTQIGVYGYETDKFKEYLKFLPEYPIFAFPPKEIEMNFDGSVLTEVHKWLETTDAHFIFLYGENDPWSAARVEKINEDASLLYILKGRHHGDTEIFNLTDTEQEELYSLLKEWLRFDYFD
jgi:hypothetical protein